MVEISRRQVLAVAALAAPVYPTMIQGGQAYAEENARSTIKAWCAIVSTPAYSNEALVFERPEGKLVLEYPSEDGEMFSPYASLGRAYYAPPELKVLLETEVEVPSMLLVRASQAHDAHNNLMTFDELLRATLSEE